MLEKPVDIKLLEKLEKLFSLDSQNTPNHRQSTYNTRKLQQAADEEEAAPFSQELQFSWKQAHSEVYHIYH